MVRAMLALLATLALVVAAPQGAEPGAAREPAPARKGAPAADPDEELLRNIEEIDKLELLQNLELFDPDDPPVDGGPSTSGQRPEPPRKDRPPQGP